MSSLSAGTASVISGDEVLVCAVSGLLGKSWDLLELLESEVGRDP